MDIQKIKKTIKEDICVKIVERFKKMWGQNKPAFICGVLAAVCLLIGVFMLINSLVTAKKSEEKMDSLRVEVQDIKQEIASQQPSVEAPAGTETPVEENRMMGNPYVDVFAQNEDMAAWLMVPDTKMDYPVMQTMENETYYIDKDFYGNPDKAGCLLLDTDSDLMKAGTTNLIIHGHNMKAGTMFGELELYQEKDYGTKHKTMELYTLEEKRTYEVISVFYSQVFYNTDTCFKYYNFFEAETEEEFAYFYDNIKSMSLYDTGVTAELGDSFLTLSTCSYHVEDGRFVVIAKETAREAYSQ